MNRGEVLEPGTVPTAGDDEVAYEIVNDQRVELPPMGAFETVLAFELAAAIDRIAKSRGLGQRSRKPCFV